MDGSALRVSWTPLKMLEARFAANVRALGGRRPELAAALRGLAVKQAYQILATAETIQLGVGDALGVTPLPHSLTAPQAGNLIRQLYPSATCGQPVLIAGEDMGWLWNGIYQLPCQTPAVPGHQPPLFFLIRDIERLWVLLHVHDWRALLADERVRLFVGDGALNEFRRSLVTEHACPWPRLSVRVDPTLWDGKPTLEEILAEATAKTTEQFERCAAKFGLASVMMSPEGIVARIGSGRPLRVLGITSRFTTFLQYSMRDWLASFERLGHQTRLMIEEKDHHFCNGMTTALACAEFVPDLVVIIDHYRGELRGVAEGVPMVMWVQDRLPNIYSPAAGPLQKRLDYVIGYGRTELVQRCGYPRSRFMPAMVGVNPERFSDKAVSEAELSPLRCDVSFVSHASMPAEEIIQEQLQRNGSPETRRLLDDLYGRFRAIYDAGGSVTAGEQIRKIIADSLRDNHLTAEMSGLMDLFSSRVNNAMFRHQAIRWVAETGVDLRLYGKGWENHSEFKRFARGVANNESQLRAIYQASTINLQVTPFGGVHQRLLDGLVAGGFFLIRSVTADELEIIMRGMWEWCRERGVRSGGEMLEKRDAALSRLFERYAALGVVNPAEDADYFFAAIEECALSGFTRTVNTLFDRHERVTFTAREQLKSQVTHFLAAPDERREIVREMRQRVLDTHTYDSITRRMLAFMAQDLKQMEQESARSQAA